MLTWAQETLLGKAGGSGTNTSADCVPQTQGTDCPHHPRILGNTMEVKK